MTTETLREVRHLRRANDGEVVADRRLAKRLLDIENLAATWDNAPSRGDAVIKPARTA